VKLTRILLADDHVLVRAGVRALLESVEGVEVVAEAGDGHEALRLVAQHRPDLVLMDISLPSLQGLEAAARVVKGYPQTRVIILSMHNDEEYVRQALRLGVAGYLVKGGDRVELELAIKAAVRGDVYLSPRISRGVVTDSLQRGPLPVGARLTGRQKEVLQLIAEGHTTKEIARQLGLSVKTAESHRTQVMERLGIHDVAGLVRYAIRSGLVSPET
jgi:DNA-binding NarL/FixJ family response regulator